MLALTVCQPYAGFLMEPLSNPLAKRVENRTWATAHRGLLAIHAGASRKWLESWSPMYDGPYPEPMAFSAVLGTVELVDCVPIAGGIENIRRTIRQQGNIIHVCGPICWIVRKPRRLKTPIAAAGAQGLWRLPAELERRVLAEPAEVFA